MKNLKQFLWITLLIIVIFGGGFYAGIKTTEENNYRLRCDSIKAAHELQIMKKRTELEMKKQADAKLLYWVKR